MPSATEDTERPQDSEQSQPVANSRSSSSPSPPPQAPTAATPGPRATAFITLYNNALSSTLKSVSYDSFAACFPLIAAQAPEALKAMHSGMVGGLEGFGKDEFETILQERNVIENLNRLEDLIADARRRKARAVDGENGEPAQSGLITHTLPPSALVAAHLAPLHISQQSQLNARLQTTQSQNATLMREIEAQRAEIEDLLRVVDVAVGDLAGAGEMLGEEVEGMAREAREVEGVLSGF